MSADAKKEDEPFYADFTTTKKGDTAAMGKVWEVLLWKDPMWSGIYLALALVWFYLTTFGGYTLIGLTSVITLVHLVVSILTSILSAWREGDGLPDKEAPQFDLAAVSRAAGSAAGLINALAAWYWGVLHGRDLAGAAKVVGGLCATYVVGGWFDAYTILLLAVLAAFSLPVAYDKNRAVVDAQVAKLKASLDQAIEKVSAQVNKGAKPADKKEDKKDE
uniref:Reticulon-like protein n=1 Tax=Hemiselmis tepida TaxID=464990 RepID=A0A7S0WBJ8_9CRYP